MRMKNHFETDHRNEPFRAVMMLFLATVFLLNCISPAAAQKEKKKKKDETPAADSSKTLVPLSDEQQIDYMLSEMLGAWQVGDVEKLRAKYADDVSMVNGSWAPPVIGWTNYLAIYQQQRARMQQVRLDRSNTYIKVNGNIGWACYQWDFSAVVDGQPVQSQGQTTVVVEKRNNHWIIMHNHTSLSPGSPQPAPANTPATQQTPAKPAQP
jgi:ketosteroid isomerase-like protein